MLRRALTRLVGPPEVIGAEECPIMLRWTLWGEDREVDGKVVHSRFKLLVHYFIPGASDRDYHDHPRPFVTMVLWGGYDDLRPAYLDPGGEDPMPLGSVVTSLRAGSVRFRRAHYTHNTRGQYRGAWSVVVMGPIRRRWGFLRREHASAGRRPTEHWIPWRDYKRLYGAATMRCD